MVKIIFLILAMLFSASSFADAKNIEAEYQDLIRLIDQRASEIERDFNQNNEEALYSFNIDEKNTPLFDKVSKFRKDNPQYKDKFKAQIDRMNAILDKVNERHAKEEPKARQEAIDALKKASASLSKSATSKDADTNFVSYDEWFTLQSTGIKSGKKYSFIACVNGQRSLTAIQCHVPGSAAKRVFYNTDDIKNLEVKKKWVNTINQNMCVTAYVTGHDAFIVDLKDQSECK